MIKKRRQNQTEGNHHNLVNSKLILLITNKIGLSKKYRSLITRLMKVINKNQWFNVPIVEGDL